MDIIDKILKEARWIGKVAIDFPNQKAFDTYMKEHPEADPNHHKIIDKEKEPSQKEDLKDKIEKKKEELKTQKEPSSKENLKDKIDKKKEELKTHSVKEDLKDKIDKKKEELTNTLTNTPKISFDKTTKEQRMEYATYDDTKSQMKSNLDKIRQPVKFEKVEGKFETKKLKTLVSNARSSITSYSKYLAKDSKNLAHEYVDTVSEILKNHGDEFSGHDAKDIDALLRDGVDKLIHQEVESNRQSFNDHGVRHIVKNIQMQQQIVGELENSGARVTGRQKLLGVFAMLNHDIGYAAPTVRQGGGDGKKSSGEHKEYSKKITAEQKDLWNSDKIFSEKEYTEALDLIEHHDDAILDTSNPMKFATSLADNLAVFQKEKLPGMFRYVKDNKKLLTDLGEPAAKVLKLKKQLDGDKDKKIPPTEDSEKRKQLQSEIDTHTKKFEDVRKDFHKQIDDSDMDENLKRDLKSAINDMSFVTPKFTLGTLAGSISKIKKSGDNPLEVEIKHNEFDGFLQKHFDMGQNQTKKLLEAYKIKEPYDKKEYDLGGVVKIKVK